MYAWENPTSIASGILDDETYDWVQLAEGMHKTDGEALLVDDKAVVSAKDFAEQVFKVSLSDFVRNLYIWLLCLRLWDSSK